MSQKSDSNTELYDILIIGGGPTGLFAAFYAGIRGMHTKILDSLSELGGQLMTLYPEKYIYDIPGFPKVLAKDFAGNLMEQAMTFKPTICLSEKVLELHHIELDGAPTIKLVTEPGGIHYGRALLITSGVGAFTPKKPELPDIDRFEGNGLSYFVRHKNSLAGKRVLVVGGGDSAIDWALTALEVTDTVYLVHRRNEFRAQEESVHKLKTSSVVLKIPCEVSSIGGKESVEWVTIVNSADNTEETIPIDHIIFSLGFQTNAGPLRNWGLDMEKSDIKVNSRMESSVPGIYAAGDTSWFPGKLKLIVTGLGEAAIAVNAIKSYTDPGARFFPGHSSDKLKSLG